MIKMRKNRRRIQETGASLWEARGYAQLWKRMSSIPGKTGFRALHLGGICKSAHGVFLIFSHALIVAATTMCIADLSSRQRDWPRAPELLCFESLRRIRLLSFAPRGQTTSQCEAIHSHSSSCPAPIFSNGCFLRWNFCTLNPVLILTSCRTRSSKSIHGNRWELASVLTVHVIGSLQLPLSQQKLLWTCDDPETLGADPPTPAQRHLAQLNSWGSQEPNLLLGYWLTTKALWKIILFFKNCSCPQCSLQHYS